MISKQNENSTHGNSARVLPAVERRLETMRALADELRQSSDAVVNLDVLRLERVSERQRQLCEELRTLNGELAGVEVQGASSDMETVFPREAQLQAEELRREMANLQSEIARLSRVHQALLRRAHRSTQVMANVLAFCFPLYAPLEENGWPGAPLRARK